MSLSEQAEHTPTPWFVVARAEPVMADYDMMLGWEVHNVDDDFDAPPDQPQRGQFALKADAEFVVRACNAHDALVTALKKLLSSTIGISGRNCGGCGELILSDRFEDRLSEEIERAQIALVQAGAL